MMTLCPSRSERRVPISRNVMSTDLPAANGTTISIGRLGHGCGAADAAPVIRARPATTPMSALACR
jgi:hypothetical protein